MSLHAIRLTGVQGAAMTAPNKDTLIDSSALLYEEFG